MPVKARYKKPKPELSREQNDFCKLYAGGKSSLEAYNESHCHINKVRASVYLQNPWVWDGIVREFRLSGREKHVIDAYDRCVEITGKTPTKIFFEYCQNKRHYDKKDSDPLHPLRLCCLAWGFFYCIEREYFLKRLHEVIVQDYEVVSMLISKNPAWMADFDSFRKMIKGQGVNFSQILSYDKP